jgi:hypothetical protein
VLLSISALKWPKSDITIGYLPPPMIDTRTTYSMTEGFLSPNTHPHKMLISVGQSFKKIPLFKINWHLYKKSSISRFSQIWLLTKYERKKRRRKIIIYFWLPT